MASACRARTAAAAPSASATPSGSTSRPATNISRCATSIRIGGGRFEVRDSPLSEFGVLGFEYGYSLADPRTLVLWEAQFGDFANGAQSIIDQFIAAGEAKWLRASGLVMLLPHGFEGQGPEHSSARLERYLQLCAEDNMQVANCTTPANYFHILRRQMRRDFRKPLVLMTPKSLLRHKLAVSNAADFTGDSHFRRILSDLNPPAEGETRRLVLCSGKLAYELMEARDAGRRPRRRDRPHRAALSLPVRAAGQAPEGDAQAAGRRLGAGRAEEQRRLDSSSSRCSRQCLAEAGFSGMRPQYAGRDAGASPATGLAKRHAAEQAALIAAALGHSSRRNDRRRRRNKGKPWPPTSKSPRSGNRSPKARSRNG